MHKTVCTAVVLRLQSVSGTKSRAAAKFWKLVYTVAISMMLHYRPYESPTYPRVSGKLDPESL